MFSLPSDFITGIGTNATSVIASLAPYIELVLGVLLAVVVLSYLISAITHHK
jgi:hypothetical protein